MSPKLPKIKSRDGSESTYSAASKRKDAPRSADLWSTERHARAESARYCLMLPKDGREVTVVQTSRCVRTSNGSALTASTKGTDTSGPRHKRHSARVSDRSLAPMESTENHCPGYSQQSVAGTNCHLTAGHPIIQEDCPSK